MNKGYNEKSGLSEDLSHDEADSSERKL